MNGVRLGDVPAVVGEEAMVGQGVHHGAGPADYVILVFRKTGKPGLFNRNNLQSFGPAGSQPELEPCP